MSKYEGWNHGPYWLAYWDDNSGNRVSRRFSISRYGEQNAFTLALRAREEGVRHFRKRYDKLVGSLDLRSDRKIRRGSDL